MIIELIKLWFIFSKYNVKVYECLFRSHQFNSCYSHPNNFEYQLYYMPSLADPNTEVEFNFFWLKWIHQRLGSIHQILISSLDALNPQYSSLLVWRFEGEKYEFSFEGNHDFYFEIWPIILIMKSWLYILLKFLKYFID